MNTNRQPIGSPIGGQFAPSNRPAPTPGVTLADPRKVVTDQLRAALDWEQDGGIDRHAFDAALPAVPEAVRDDAWKSAIYIADQLQRVWCGEDVDSGEDSVAGTAYDDAEENASGGGEDYGYDLMEQYDTYIKDGYGDEMFELREALVRAQFGEAVAYQPVRPDLPAIDVAERLSVRAA